MLKFEQEHGAIVVRSGAFKIGEIYDLGDKFCLTYTICLDRGFYCGGYAESGDQFETLKAAQDKITAKWNEWLDKAGLQKTRSTIRKSVRCSSTSFKLGGD